MARYNAYGELDTRYQEDLDSAFTGINSRARPDSLGPGIVQTSENFRFDRAGVAQVRKGIEVKSAPLTLDTARAFTLPFNVWSNLTSTSVTRTGSTQLTFTRSSQWQVESDKLVGITVPAGITGFTQGNYKGTLSEDGENFVVTGLSGLGGTATGSATLGAPFLDVAFTSTIYGSCLFADPKNNGEPYIIIAANDKAVAIKISDSTTTDIAYPTGVLLSTEANLIQGFNKVFAFRAGETALEWDGILTGSPAFAKVPNGAYTEPATGTATTFAIANGLVTVGLEGVADSTNALYLQEGDRVRVSVVGDSGLTLNEQYRVASVTSATPDTFTFFVDNAPDIADGSVSTYPQFIKRVSEGGGYIHMPAPPFGIVHQERLVVPFIYTSAASPALRDPAVLDEVLLSEPLLPDQFDPEFGRGRLFPGTADFIQGFFSFAEDKLIIFNRNSIFVYSPTVDLASMNKALITKELGLVARNSVVQVGNNILFLSDNGIYGVSFQDLYNLRGNDSPLSEAIDPIIQRLNKDVWHKSVAVYFDNRYYIAVPSKDYNNSDKLNVILIFNFLNKKWESLDYVNPISNQGVASNWDIQNLIVAGNGDARGVYAVNSLGGLHRLDSTEVGEDSIIDQIGATATTLNTKGKLRTRQFNFQNVGRKKWNDFEVQTESSSAEASDFDMTFTTENLDNVIDAGKLSEYTNAETALAQDESISIRGRIGNERAYGIDLTIDNTVGRPKMESIRVSGGIEFNSTQSAE